MKFSTIIRSSAPHRRILQAVLPLLLLTVTLQAAPAPDFSNTFDIGLLASKLTQENPAATRRAAMARYGELAKQWRFVQSINWQIQKALGSENDQETCRLAAKALAAMPNHFGFALLEQVATIPVCRQFTAMSQAESIKVLIAERKKWAKYSVKMALRNQHALVRHETLKAMGPALDPVLASDLRVILNNQQETAANRILAANWLTELKDRSSLQSAKKIYTGTGDKALKAAVHKLITAIDPAAAP